MSRSVIASANARTTLMRSSHIRPASIAALTLVTVRHAAQSVPRL
jgi:hypothetical protein